MKKIWVFILLLVSQEVLGQRYTIQGMVADSLEGPLPYATIMVLKKADSILVNFTVSKPDGKFEIKNVTKGDYLLKASFTGYYPFFKELEYPTGSSVIDLGKIRLKPLSKELQEVIIKGDKDPITIKKDTIEYNAAAYKTRPNATVEDLLKQMPGIEVENDGSIKAQGEMVRRVTVDGKEFFGKDPTIATKNLPADAVDKVQVFDQKSDQAQFSGIDDGQREKTINLALKEEKRNTTFGRITTGAGTSERFESKGNLNRFSKGNQLSILGMANNINEQGFSMNDYMNFTGGAAQMARGGAVRLEFNSNNDAGIPLNFGGRINGIMNNYAGGLNFSKTFNKKTESNGSYFYNAQNHHLKKDVERENFLPSGNLKFGQHSDQQTYRNNHRINLTVDHKIDSLNSVRFNSYFGYTSFGNDISSQSHTKNHNGELMNESARSSFSDGEGLNLNSNLLFRHKFYKPGRTFSANTILNVNTHKNAGGLVADNTFAKGLNEQIRQKNIQENNFQSWGTTFSYTEPLGGKKYLEANYSLRQNMNQVNREVYDLEDGVQLFNLGLSNRFNSDYKYQRAGLNFRLTRNSYNFLLGSSFQNTNLRGDLLLSDARIERSFNNFLPRASFNYSFSNTKNLRVNYETSVQEPGIEQLQPVIDNSDPLNIYMGNPELRPAYAHQWQVNYHLFDPVTFVNFFVMTNATYTSNAVVYSQSFDEQLVRTIVPVNVNGNMEISGFSSFGFPVKMINSRFNFGSNVRHQKGINMLNDIESRINIDVISGNFRYEYKFRQVFDMSLRTNISMNKTRYEFSGMMDQLFFNKTFGTEANLYFLKQLHFHSSFEYLMFTNAGTGFHQTLPLLNLAFSAEVLKDKKGEVRLSMVNLLDQSLGINQVANVNFIEQERMNNLGRFFMLSFTYSLNKQLNPMGGARGGMLRMIN